MNFQYILLSIFGIAAVVAVIAFANPPKSEEDVQFAGAKGNVVIWGTFPERESALVFRAFNEKYKDRFSVQYQYHDPKTFDQDIVEALAADRGPDVLLLPNDLILRHLDKIEPIASGSMPEARFQEVFVQAAEIYKRPGGYVAFPFVIDPMVMYWNRDLFSNASITQTPRYWDELLVMSGKLTKRDLKTSDITQSTVAFGEYANVDHAKDVLAMLFLQVGNPIVSYDAEFTPVATVAEDSGNVVISDERIVSALRFYMDFSNPRKNIYSWNRSKSGALNEFVNGNLAIYFDFASANSFIAEKNPHLNFAVSQVPVPRDVKTEITHARLHGLSVLKKSKNKNTAHIVVQRLLLDPEHARDFSAAYDLPPIRRDLLAQKPSQAAMSVFYDAAIRSRTWLDPKPDNSDAGFREMVESVSSGRQNVDSAVSGLHTALSVPLRSYK